MFARGRVHTYKSLTENCTYYIDRQYSPFFLWLPLLTSPYRTFRSFLNTSLSFIEIVARFNEPICISRFPVFHSLLKSVKRFQRRRRQFVHANVQYASISRSILYVYSHRKRRHFFLSLSRSLTKRSNSMRLIRYHMRVTASSIIERGTNFESMVRNEKKKKIRTTRGSCSINVRRLLEFFNNDHFYKLRIIDKYQLFFPP